MRGAVRCGWARTDRDLRSPRSARETARRPRLAGRGPCRGVGRPDRWRQPGRNRSLLGVDVGYHAASMAEPRAVDPFKTFEHEGWEQVARPYREAFSALTAQTIPA